MILTTGYTNLKTDIGVRKKVSSKMMRILKRKKSELYTTKTTDFPSCFIKKTNNMIFGNREFEFCSMCPCGMVGPNYHDKDYGRRSLERIKKNNGK